MTQSIFYLLAFGLIWLARMYAAVTPIADLGVVRIPATAAVAAVLLLAATVAILRRMCRDTPVRLRPDRQGRTSA